MKKRGFKVAVLLYPFTNLFLILILLFISLPVITHDVHAQSDNITSNNSSLSDNVSIIYPPITDNLTSSNSPSSDNKSPKIPPLSGNISIQTTNLTDSRPSEPPALKKQTKVVKPDEEAQLASSDNRIALKIPKGSVSETAEFSLQEKFLSDSTGTRMVKFFELNAFTVSSSGNSTNIQPPISENSTAQATLTSDNATPVVSPKSGNLTSANLTQRKPITQFSKELQITLKHTPEDLRGLDIDSLHLYYLDEGTRQWVLVPGTFDRKTLTLTANVTHFTNYGEQANPLQNGPGRVMAAEVDLHSGTATFSYPFELPPGPGGFQPKIDLTYNSGSADGMKNKRDVGSWVGIGWSLHLGRISCDLSTNRYFLDLNGTSYELFSTNDTNYRIHPEQYYKITRSGNTWTLLDKEGNTYQFGGTDNSTQYVYDTSTKYYRWDLSLIKDTNSNNATISYVQDISDSTVHSAYPQYLRYGTDNVSQVYFSFSANRTDNPAGTGANPAPKIIENRKLDSIEITFNGTLIRKYGFDYATTNCTYSSDYSGIYYAGKHTLSSITQFGTDNTSLPSMTFEYQNLQTYRHTTEGGYNGNPGNPASFYWPHLTRIYSGYGGTIDFGYTQIPGSTTDGIWTRQAVTTKTIDPTYYSGVWWSTSWSYRKKITFNTTSISENLTGFPVLVHLTTSNFDFGLASANGIDLRFIDSDNSTILKYEIEKWTANEEAWIWVKMPQLDGNSTTDHIWIYYGNSNATDGQDPANVWDSNFVLVNHMHDDGTKDSTSPTNTGTHYGTTETMGAIGKGQNFDGVNDYITLGNSSDLNLTNVGTVEVILSLNTMTSGQYPTVVGKGADAGWDYPGYAIWLYSTSGVWGSLGAISQLVNFGIPTYDIFYSYCLNWNGTLINGYKNGVLVASNNQTQSANPSGRDFLIGKLGEAGHYLKGKCDEIRVSNIARSADWIKASYLTQTDNLTGSYGSKEDRPEYSSEIITTTYTYTGDPAYLGTGWDQEFRGWNEIKQTDAAGNYVKHWFYTTGEIEGKEAEIFTGKEYKTEWYDSSNNTLKSKIYDWSWEATDCNKTTLTLRPNSDESIQLQNGSYTQVDDDGWDGLITCVYAISSSQTRDLYGLSNPSVKNGGISAIITYAVFQNGYQVQGYGRTAIKTNGTEYFGSEIASGNFYPPYYTIYSLKPQTQIAWTWDEVDNLQAGFAGRIVGESGSVYCTAVYVEVQVSTLIIKLDQVDEITYNTTSGNKTARTRYIYDNYGNAITEYLDGDITADSDNSTVHREFYPNTAANILSKVAREWVECVSENQSNTVKESRYYYDGNNTSYTTPPTKGNLTRLDQKKDASNSVSSYFTYYANGNMQTSTDPKGNSTNWTYDATGTYPDRKTIPNGCSENYTYLAGTSNLLGVTDINNQTMKYEYDYFNRLIKTIKPGDTSNNATIVYAYDRWGTLEQQNITILTKTANDTYLWQKDYFDGLGRVLQTQSCGDSGNITTTIAYNNRGLIEKQYVAQSVSSNVSGYRAPEATWRYASSTYDALGRVVTQTAADNTTVIHSYATAWQDLVTNQRGFNKRYSNDAFNRLSSVIEYDSTNQTYATTTYTYDVLGNLKQVVDANGNSTNMTYDWLSHKTVMSDPDMGAWTYAYDNNGNLTIQTDARSWSITMLYDNLNRLTGKNYPVTANMTNIVYTYDQGTNGKGRRTAMSDASGTTLYTYDARGRLIEEVKMISSGNVSSDNIPPAPVINLQVGNPGSDNLTLTWTAPGDDGIVGTASQYDIRYATWPITEFNWASAIQVSGEPAPSPSGTSETFTVTGLNPGTTYYFAIKTADEVPNWSQLYECPSGTTTGQGVMVFTTKFYYDNADRLVSVIYPTGENVTQGYSARGLPYSLNGTLAGPLVSGMSYNALAQPTQIDLGNGLKTTYSYWGIDHETSSFRRLWEIKTQLGTNTPLQQVRHTWDNGGNLSNRYDALTADNENFTYDFLDRLTGVSGNYTESYTYNAIGNTLTKNGVSYTYGARPHAVTAVGTTSYAYDANGNMYQRGSQTLIWDAENRPVSVSANGTTAYFVYDGDGNRVKKVEGGQTVLYINRFFEVNLTTSTNTSYYYLGGSLIAMSVNSTLRYIHQDHLTGTSVITSASGALLGTIKYTPFGETRSVTGTIYTDKLFTGQRLDNTGLYFYNARYYDPTIGRFISADTVIPNPADPQCFNRYSYVLNNPLRFTDPSGHNVILHDPPDPEPPFQDPGFPPDDDSSDGGGGDGTGGGGLDFTEPKPEIRIQCKDFNIVVFDTLGGNKLIVGNRLEITIRPETLEILLSSGLTYEDIVLSTDLMVKSDKSIINRVNYNDLLAVTGSGLLLGLVGNKVGNKDPILINQGTIKALANERMKFKGGLTAEEARIINGWAKEYGLYSSIHEPHYNRQGYYSTLWHLKLGGQHYPIIDPWNLQPR